MTAGNLKYRKRALPLGFQLLQGMPLPRKIGILERIYGRALARRGVVEVMLPAGVRWKLDLSEVSHRRVLFGEYQGSGTMNWLRNWLRPGGLVVDSGVNIGQLMIHMALIKNVRVLALEPSPEVAEWLRGCLSLYPSWNVEVIEKGLSNEKGCLKLQMDGPRSTFRNDWYRSSGFRKIDVDVVKLDDLLFERNESRVRFWKLDVEGFEYEALQGAGRFLREKRIDAIMIEQNSTEKLKDVIAYLNSCGYTVHSLNRANRFSLVDGKPGETIVLGDLFSFPTA